MRGYAGASEGTVAASFANNLQAIMNNKAEVHHPFTNHIPLYSK
jgi:hypothetical protein